MTYLLDELRGAGLVERRPDPADRRARRVALTDDGRRAALRAGASPARRPRSTLLEPLDAAERDTLRRCCCGWPPARAAGRQSACEIARELDGGPHAPVP